MNPKYYMVFDVESVGLHGEGWAYGYVVLDDKGVLQEEGLRACLPDNAEGTIEGRDWLSSNVPVFNATHSLPEDLRREFWNTWLKWKALGAVLVADCNWPVEARFLNQCVDDNPKEREWQGPYPFLDLGSILFALGRDPLKYYPRLPCELPVHNPLCDARQSARLLVETLKLKE